MRTRISLPWIAAAAVCLASAAVIGQRGAAVARPVAPDAVQKAERQIDNAAAGRGIKLTDAAREALAKEAVHQEATAPAPAAELVTGTLSDDTVSNLLTPLAAAPQDKTLDVRDVQTRVVDNKTSQVVATLPADITAHEQASGKAVPDEVRRKLVEDLSKQSEALSQSGLAVEAIRERNEQTLKAVDRAIGTSPMTIQSYQTAMADIFTKHVFLSILSTPDGATVSAEGTSIGRTRIADKQVKPGTYTFKFQLAGYADTEREYYVAPGLDSDSFTQVLTAASGPAPPSPTPHTPIPIGYIILGGIIVVLLAALVLRRREG